MIINKVSDFCSTALAKQLVRDEATGNVIMRVVARMQRGESFGVGVENDFNPLRANFSERT